MVGSALRADLVVSGRVGTACQPRRIAVSVWRIGNGSASGRGATASRPFANRHTNLQRLPLVGLALRANLAASRELRSRSALRTPYSVIWFNLSTFPQAEGRFPPLHGYLAALRPLSSALCPLFRYSLFHLCTGAPLRFAPLHSSVPSRPSAAPPLPPYLARLLDRREDEFSDA